MVPACRPLPPFVACGVGGKNGGGGGRGGIPRRIAVETSPRRRRRRRAAAHDLTTFTRRAIVVLYTTTRSFGTKSHKKKIYHPNNKTKTAGQTLVVGRVWRDSARRLRHRSLLAAHLRLWKALRSVRGVLHPPLVPLG